MASRTGNHRVRITLVVFAVFGLLCSVGELASAQDRPYPKWEVFGGYSFFYPGADVHGLLPGGILPVSSRLESNPRGAGASVNYNFARWLGLTADFSVQKGSGEQGVQDRIDDASLANLSFGPKITFRTHYFSPFFEGLVGLHRLSSDLFRNDTEIGGMMGGGLDINVKRHLALRLIRADYVISNHQFGSNVAAETDLRGVRLQSGIVLMLGGEAPRTVVSVTCSVAPQQIMAGEPAALTASGNGFNPKHKLHYTWSGNGGKITGQDNAASIDTSGMAGGSYNFTAEVSDPKMSKGGNASCTATLNVTVRDVAKRPPTITCTASPSAVRAGDAGTIACQGNSPDDRPLTYNHVASSGRLSSSGPNATVDTTGLLAGPVTVTSNVTDDRQLTASTTSGFTVEAPAPPPTPSKLNEITFPNEKKPARVDNTAKAIMDDVALRLQRDPGSKAVVVGYATSGETGKKINRNLAAQRAINTKACLDGAETSCENQGKQVDASRIEVRVGTGDQNKAEIWIVPSGASFTGEGTTIVDESKFKAQSRTAEAAHHKKSAE